MAASSRSTPVTNELAHAAAARSAALPPLRVTNAELAVIKLRDAVVEAQPLLQRVVARFLPRKSESEPYTIRVLLETFLSNFDQLVPLTRPAEERIRQKSLVSEVLASCYRVAEFQCRRLSLEEVLESIQSLVHVLHHCGIDGIMTIEACIPDLSRYRGFTRAPIKLPVSSIAYIFFTRALQRFCSAMGVDEFHTDFVRALKAHGKTSQDVKIVLECILFGCSILHEFDLSHNSLELLACTAAVSEMMRMHMLSPPSRGRQSYKSLADECDADIMHMRAILGWSDDETMYQAVFDSHREILRDCPYEAVLESGMDRVMHLVWGKVPRPCPSIYFAEFLDFGVQDGKEKKSKDNMLDIVKFVPSIATVSKDHAVSWLASFISSFRGDRRERDFRSRQLELLSSLTDKEWLHLRSVSHRVFPYNGAPCNCAEKFRSSFQSKSDVFFMFCTERAMDRSFAYLMFGLQERIASLPAADVEVFPDESCFATDVVTTKNPSFIARAECDALFQMAVEPVFTSYENASTKLLLLRGCPGVGKSTAVKEGIRRILSSHGYHATDSSVLEFRSIHEDHFNVYVLRITCRTRRSVLEQIQQMARKLLKNCAPHLLHQQFYRLLMQSRYLAIVDDADETGLQEVLMSLPKTRHACSLLVTSQMLDMTNVLPQIISANWSDDVSSFEMQPFSYSECRQLMRNEFTRMTGAGEIYDEFMSGHDKELQEVFNKLHRLPLFLQLFFRWIFDRFRNELAAPTSHVTQRLLSEFLRSFDSQSGASQYQGLRAITVLLMKDASNVQSEEGHPLILALLRQHPTLNAQMPFFLRFDVNLHQRFDRQHKSPTMCESMVFWSQKADILDVQEDSHAISSVVSTLDCTRYFDCSSVEDFENIKKLYTALYERVKMKSDLFVPFTYYIETHVATTSFPEDPLQSNATCVEAKCYVELIQSYYEVMRSLDDVRVIDEIGRSVRPSFPEEQLRYIAKQILEALIWLYSHKSSESADHAEFEYGVLNPSAILLSEHNGQVRLSAPLFSPRRDCLKSNRFAANENVLCSRETDDGFHRDYSSPDNATVSSDAWAFVVTLIELRTGSSFRLKSAVDDLQARLQKPRRIDNLEILWDEVVQSFEEPIAALFSQDLLNFLRSIIHCPISSTLEEFSKLLRLPWFLGDNPNDLLSWIRQTRITTRPWMSKDSLLNYVKRHFFSSDATPFVPYDQMFPSDMGTMCNIDDVNSQEWIARLFPRVPPEILHLATKKNSFDPIYAFLRDLSTFGEERLAFVRIMMVGIGEVGKTRLVKALESVIGCSHEDISRENRTVAVEVTEFKFNETMNVDDELTACVWDFAGQADYYMTHSLFMSERAIYMLVWKRSDNPQEFSLSDQECSGINVWLEMLAASVPNAAIVVVGTHSNTPRNGESATDYTRNYRSIAQSVRAFTEQQCASINRFLKSGKMTLVHFFDVDSKTGDGVQNLKSQLHRLSLKMPFVDIKIPSSYNIVEGCIRQFNRDPGENEYILSEQDFANKCQEFQGKLSAEKYTKDQHVKLTKIFLKKKKELGGSVAPEPKAKNKDAVKSSLHSKRVPDPFNLQHSQIPAISGDSPGGRAAESPPASISDTKAQRYVETQLQVEDYEPSFESAAHESTQDNEDKKPSKVVLLQISDIRKGLEFWHQLGIVYVRNGYVIMKPQIIVDFLKPLVHRDPVMMLQANEVNDPCNMLLSPECYRKTPDNMLKILRDLKDYSSISTEHLKFFKFWNELSYFKTDFMVIFLSESLVVHRSVRKANFLRVTARAHCRPIPVLAHSDIERPYCVVFPIRQYFVDFLALAETFLIQRMKYVQLDVQSGRNESAICLRFHRKGAAQQSAEIHVLRVNEHRTVIPNFSGTSPRYLYPDYGYILCVNATNYGIFRLAVYCAEFMLSTHSIPVDCLLPTKVRDEVEWFRIADGKSLGGMLEDKQLNGLIPESDTVTIYSYDDPQSDPRRFCRIYPRVYDICVCMFSSSTNGTSCFCRTFCRMIEQLCCSSVAVLNQHSPSSHMANVLSRVPFVIVLLTPDFFVESSCENFLKLCVDDRRPQPMIIPLFPSVSQEGLRRVTTTGLIANTIQNMSHSLRAQCSVMTQSVSQETKDLLSIDSIQSIQNLPATSRQDAWLLLAPWQSDHSPTWNRARFASSQDRASAIVFPEVQVDLNMLPVKDIDGLPCSRLSLFSETGDASDDSIGLMNMLLQVVDARLRTPLHIDYPAPHAQSFSREIRTVHLLKSRSLLARTNDHDSALLPAEFFAELLSLGLNDDDIIACCGMNDLQVRSKFLACQYRGSHQVPLYHRCAFIQSAERHCVDLSQVSSICMSMLPEFLFISSDSLGSTSDSVGLHSSSSINFYVERFFSENKELDTSAIRQDLKAILDTETESSLFDIEMKELSCLNKHKPMFALRFTEFLFRHRPRRYSNDEECFTRMLSDEGLQIVKKIATGGQGTVFKCIHVDGRSRDRRTTPSPCAVKFVKSHNIDAFQSEVDSLHRLSKDHVIRLYEVFKTQRDGDDYVSAFSMEYIPSGDLRKHLSRKKAKMISRQAFIRIAEQLLKSLTEMHRLSPPLFHYDIKPGNILLTGIPSDDIRDTVSTFFKENQKFNRSDIRQDLKTILDEENDCSFWDLKIQNFHSLNNYDSNFASEFHAFLSRQKSKSKSFHAPYENASIKICDFGLSRDRVNLQESASLSANSFHCLRGTPSYLSPEQFQSEPFCESDDCWSAARVLAELLCGTLFESLPPGMPIDDTFLRTRCPLHLKCFIPAIIGALNPDKERRITSPALFLTALKSTSYDVAILYQPTSTNEENSFSMDMEIYLTRMGINCHRSRIGKNLHTVANDTVFDIFAQFEAHFNCTAIKLYKDVMLKMVRTHLHDPPLVFDQLPTLHDETNPVHKNFTDNILNYLDDPKDKTPKRCFLGNANMRILVQELDLHIQASRTRSRDLRADDITVDVGSGPIEMMKCFTNAMGDTPNDAIAKVQYSHFDLQAKFKIFSRLVLFDKSIRDSCKQMISIRNKRFGHPADAEMSGEEFNQVVERSNNAVKAFQEVIQPQHPFRRFPIDVFTKLQNEELQKTLHCSVAVPILSDSAIISSADKIDILLRQCLEVKSCLSQVSSSSSSAQGARCTSASFLRFSIPVFLSRSKESHTHSQTSLGQYLDTLKKDGSQNHVKDTICFCRNSNRLCAPEFLQILQFPSGNERLFEKVHQRIWEFFWGEQPLPTHKSFQVEVLRKPYSIFPHCDESHGSVIKIHVKFIQPASHVNITVGCHLKCANINKDEAYLGQLLDMHQDTIEVDTKKTDCWCLLVSCKSEMPKKKDCIYPVFSDTDTVDGASETAAKAGAKKTMGEGKPKAASETKKKEEAKLKEAEEERLRIEAQARKAEEERLKAEAEARKAEEERRKAEAEVEKLKEERLRADAETKRKADEITRLCFAIVAISCAIFAAWYISRFVGPSKH